jgi:hypothetical protein
LPQKKPEVTIKPYDKVITKDAISDDGLFMVHRVDKNIILKFSNIGQGHASGQQTVETTF